MAYVYLLTLQGLTCGTGEMYSVVGIYSSKEKAENALAAAREIISEAQLYYDIT